MNEYLLFNLSLNLIKSLDAELNFTKINFLLLFLRKLRIYFILFKYF